MDSCYVYCISSVSAKTFHVNLEMQMKVELLFCIKKISFQLSWFVFLQLNIKADKAVQLYFEVLFNVWIVCVDDIGAASNSFLWIDVCVTSIWNHKRCGKCTKIKATQHWTLKAENYHG